MIIRGNALKLPLADESVDLIVTSPPYYAMRTYGAGLGEIGAEATPAEFLKALWDATAEMARVLKPSGSIFVNLGDKYVNPSASGAHRGGEIQASNYRDHQPISGFVPEGMRAKSLMLLPEAYRLGCTGTLGALGGPDPGLNLIARAVLVWDKPNPVPDPAPDRVGRSHEDWVHLTRQPRYYSATDKYGSTWRIQSEPVHLPEHLGVRHFAPFPSEWPRRLILGWSPPDGIVLDPFAGIGTTPMVARMLGRIGIGVDLSADYCRAAHWRVRNGDDRVTARMNLGRQETLAIR